MRILYVVSRPLEINTSASIRNKASIKGLLELGHQVDLITTTFDINHTNFDPSLKQDGLEIKYISLKGIQGVAKIGRKYKLLSPIKKFLYSSLSRIEVYDNLRGIINHVSEVDLDKKYDLIISSSDPKSSHLFVSKLLENNSDLKGIPWFQIWRIFLTDITRNGAIMSRRIKKQELMLLNRATKIIYVSKLTQIEQQKIYPENSEKMVYIPVPYLNSVEYPEINLSSKQLTFLYCGDYNSTVRNLKPLYDALKNTNHKLIICGNTDLKLEESEQIKIYPRVEYSKVKELEAKADVLVHLSNKQGNQIPGKIYQYSGTNKPILFILDGNEKIIYQV